MSNKELIIDTGFFIAILSQTDQFHAKALKLQGTINRRKWITTWPVLTEVCHLLWSRNASQVISCLLQMYEEKEVMKYFHCHEITYPKF